MEDGTQAEAMQRLMECLSDLQTIAQLGPGRLLVVGASTSEIVGHRIGTATSVEVGQSVVHGVLQFAGQVGCDVGFQCCEHLNRCVVLSKSVARARGYRQVTAIPVPGAGGAVAAVAYFALNEACLVEAVEADAGIDIGDTLIGMHLRRVAVPVRGRHTEIGGAHVTMASSRPPLVGGTRAVYDVEEAWKRINGSNGTSIPLKNDSRGCD
jgi:uncharacterized protein (TIGR01440 family)